ncbi:MAG: peptide-methionine (R)-S-oxide reductase, partial [Dinoroseobacter sp.]|nr:peptide-methionine (R)-S-oxide reductase [Dinoroseobacter sp.]
MEKVVKTDEEWRASLDPLAYKVLRKHGTERAGTHDNFPKKPGVYRCRACGSPLFDAATKFESGTGWPSFYAPIDDEMVGESVDKSWFMTRTEVHCNR